MEQVAYNEGNNVPDKLKPLMHTADFTLNSQLNYSPSSKVHYVF